MCVPQAGNSFKQRYQAHRSTLNNKDHKQSTALSRHFWKIKLKQKKDPTIKWEIVEKTSAMVSEKFGCMLCNLEKITIARTKKDQSLNIRNELISSCPHFLKRFFKRPPKETQSKVVPHINYVGVTPPLFTDNG